MMDGSMRWMAGLATGLCVITSAAQAQPLPGGQATSRIVGGQTVVSDTPGVPAYPWMTPLLFTPGGEFNPNNVLQFCGGTFLGPNHVLTAAHCILPSDLVSPSDISVGVGFQNLVNDAASAQVIPVTEIIIHPSGAPNSSDTADMALLVLAEPANLDDFITFNQVEIEPGTTATVIGWGTLFYGGPAPDDLQQVWVPVVSLEQCQANLSVFGSSVDATMLCAGLAEGGKDACQGDSGGPLFITDGQNRPVQIGVVSWGIGCGDPNLPGIYANVAALADFIFSAVAASAPEVGGLVASTLTPNQAQVARSLDGFAAGLSPQFVPTDLVRVYTDLVLASPAQRRNALDTMMPLTAFAQANLAHQSQTTTVAQITQRASLRHTLGGAVGDSDPLDLSQLRGISPTTAQLALAIPAPSFEPAIQTEVGTYRALATPPTITKDETFSQPSTPEIPVAPLELTPESEPEPRWSAFVAGDLLFGDSTLDTAAEVRADINNSLIMAGADYAITPELILGGALGYSNGYQRNRGFNTEASTVLMTAYGTATYGTGGYTTGYLNYGFDQYNTRRTLLLPSETRLALGTSHGRQFGLGAETGWRFTSGAFQIDPFASFRFSLVNLDGYTETGAGEASLQVESRSDKTTSANLGVQAGYSIPLEQALLFPFLRLGLNHELGNTSQSVMARFVGGGLPFTVTSGNFDRTWLNLATGLSAQFGTHTTTRLTYRTNLGRADANLHNVLAEIQHTF